MSGAQLPQSGGYAGAQGLRTGGSQFNAMAFLVRQILAGKSFGALVTVRAVHGGGVGPPPTVDVLPDVNQIDGLGNQVPHVTIYGIPVFRLQAGNSAIIMDPVVGDHGAMLICDRDISNVKATGKQSGPGSWRQNSWADGLYFGAFLGVTPTEYIQFTGNGINIVSPGTVAVTSPLLSSTGGVTAGFGGGDSVTLQGHTHTQPNDSHGDTEAATLSSNGGHMRTLFLDIATWDLIADASGNIAVATDPYSLAQDVASAVRTFLGECYYNTTLGIPYLGIPPGTTGNAILGQLPPLAMLKSKIAAAAATVPGCNNPVVFVSALGADRVLRGQVQFTDSNGQVQSIAF